MTATLRARDLAHAPGAASGFGGVNLELAGGGCLGISTSNVSARAALLHVLAALIPPASGALEIDGIDAVVRVNDARRQVVYAGPRVASARGLRAGEYLEFALAARMGRRPERADVDAALNLTALSAGDPVPSLGGRSCRDLALALALLCRPRVVLADSVGDDDDQNGGVRLKTVLDELRRHGAAVVVAVNESAAVRSACQRVLHLQSGRLVNEDRDTAPEPSLTLSTAGQA